MNTDSTTPAFSRSLLTPGLAADFLQNISTLGTRIFGTRLSVSEWRILLALGYADNRQSAVPYKNIKYDAGISDDALSRGLRKLAASGLIARATDASDKRSVRYLLSDSGAQGLQRVVGVMLAQMGTLLIAFGNHTGQT